jgi:hypothetical protein
MLDLQQEERGFNTLTLTARLEKQSRLKEVGGAAIIPYLVNACPDSLRAQEYAAIIHEKFNARKMTELAQRLAKEAISPNGGVQAIIDELQDLHTRKAAAGLLDEHQHRWSTAELYDTKFQEPRWAIPGLIPEGLTLLGGRPKVGKSWLALQMAHSVGTGGTFFGKPVEKGAVLYIALEDGPRRLQDRIKKHKIPREAMITFERDWPPLQKEGMALLFDEIVQHEYRMVIIDTLTRSLRGQDQNDQPAIDAVMSNIQRMAIDHHLAILFNDHTNKPKVNVIMGDPVDDIMNSTVKTAVADLVLALYKDQGKAGAMLKGRGRDVEEVDLELKWDPVTCCWQCEGQAGQIRMTEARKEVLETLETLGKVQLGAIANATGKDRGQVFRILNDLYSSQLIRREGIGDKVYYQSLAREVEQQVQHNQQSQQSQQSQQEQLL